jgi:hypothetical protein
LKQGREESAEPREEKLQVPPPSALGKYQVTVILQYRKIDQFLLNYLLGEGKVTAPVTELTRAAATVLVKPKDRVAAK